MQRDFEYPRDWVYDEHFGTFVPPWYYDVYETPWIDSETGKEVTPMPQVFIAAFGEE